MAIGHQPALDHGSAHKSTGASIGVAALSGHFVPHVVLHFVDYWPGPLRNARTPATTAGRTKVCDKVRD